MRVFNKMTIFCECDAIGNNKNFLLNNYNSYSVSTQ